MHFVPPCGRAVTVFRQPAKLQCFVYVFVCVHACRMMDRKRSAEDAGFPSWPSRRPVDAAISSEEGGYSHVGSTLETVKSGYYHMMAPVRARLESVTPQFELMQALPVVPRQWSSVLDGRPLARRMASVHTSSTLKQSVDTAEQRYESAVASCCAVTVAAPPLAVAVAERCHPCRYADVNTASSVATGIQKSGIDVGLAVAAHPELEGTTFLATCPGSSPYLMSPVKSTSPWTDLHRSEPETTVCFALNRCRE